jgi:hypothetical protein
LLMLLPVPATYVQSGAAWRSHRCQCCADMVFWGNQLAGQPCQQYHDGAGRAAGRCNRQHKRWRMHAVRAQNTCILRAIVMPGQLSTASASQHDRAASALGDDRCASWAVAWR